MSKQQQEIDLWAAGVFLISNDGLSVVMFLKWKNKDRTQFIGGSFPTSEKEEGLGPKATYNTCDFQVFGEKYKFETMITVNGNFYFKVVPLCELKPFDKVVVRDVGGMFSDKPDYKKLIEDYFKMELPDFD